MAVLEVRRMARIFSLQQHHHSLFNTLIVDLHNFCFSALLAVSDGFQTLEMKEHDP
jgi:hypothetical protein